MNLLVLQTYIINIKYTITLKVITLGVCILILSLFSTNTVSANTGINTQIPYSGTIVKNDGTILSDGGYRARFLIYSNASPTVGETALYQEIRNGIETYSGIVSPLLSINDGKFEILLGSQNTTGISSLNDDTLYLEIQLDMDNNGSYEEIFSPRRRIGSAMSSINSLRLVANGGTSTNTLSLDTTGNLIFTGDGATERMRISGAGAITASALGGEASTTTDTNTFNRVILANSSGQFSQVALSSILSQGGGGSGWGLNGNVITTAWTGSTGSFLGTTSTQPLVIATTNATAQDIRFFTGANGANERMRILGNGNIGIGTTTPQARLDVAGGVRIGDDTSACTSSNVGTLRYSNSALQVCTNSGWSYVNCPPGYIPVPGNSLYGTNDFCVMKYEAKTGSATVSATTQATGNPQVSISQTNAITACSLNGAGYGLINNNEWMTITRNIEGQGVNWTGGTVGSGGLWRGHSDNSPNNALAASTDDNQGYEGTGNTSPSIERRTHTLSNGETIWDLSGNVWEWTNNTILGKDQPTGATPGFTWREYTAITNYGTLSYDLTRPSNTSWNSSQNMGQIYSDGTSTNTTTFAFLRGGVWGNATIAGVFTLRLLGTPSLTYDSVGFRCVVR